MKRRIVYTLFVTAFCTFLLLSNSGGTGATQQTDRTGSPLSPGICSECHGGGSFAPSVEARLLKNNAVVTQYTPGEDYTFRLTITATNGTPARYGFMAVALRSNNTNAGTWDSPPAGTRTITINGREYFEQSSPRTANSFDIKWKAPAAGSGLVRFYAAGNAVNGNGSTSGDAAAQLPEALVISERSTSAAFGVKELEASMLAYPNPVNEQLNLNIEVKEIGRYFLSIYDMTGKELQRKTLLLQSGKHQETFEVTNLAAGHYAVRLSDGERLKTLQIVKK